MTSLERILRLARQTGDTVILADEEGKKATVILPLRRYEALIVHEQDEVGALLMEAEEKSVMPIVSDTPESTSSGSAGITEPVTRPLREEKQQEQAKNPATIPGGEEEQFYLEPVD